MTVQIEVREETAIKLQAIATNLRLSLDEYLSSVAKVADLLTPAKVADRVTTTETLDQQNEAMLAVLARSAERQKNMPVSGNTKDTLEMIRRARDGEMWGYESAN